MREANSGTAPVAAGGGGADAPPTGMAHRPGVSPAVPRVGVRVAVDTGGTFTDVVATDGGRTVAAKVPTDPTDPAGSFMAGLEAVAAQWGLPVREFLQHVEGIAHGTTLGVNSLLEGRVGRCALLATEGFRDALEIRRARLADQWDLRAAPPRVLVPRHLRFGVRGRIDYAGRVLEPLDAQGVRAVAAEIRRAGVEAVAVCYLFSFVNPEHETETADILAHELPGLRVSLSSRIAPRMGEYERASTAVIDACLGGAMTRYVAAVEARLAEDGWTGRLDLASSSGTLAAWGDGPVGVPGTLFSGPAGGARAAERLAAGLGAAAGRSPGARAGVGRDASTGAAGPDLIVADMGGTSFDAHLVVAGHTPSVPEGEAAGYPVAVPMLDIHSIAAGGGSIARVDTAGLLTVGPDSAGSFPGPACYGRGGTEPTITDAALVLGFLPAAEPDARESARHGARLGVPAGPAPDVARVTATSGPTLDVARAREAIEARIAAPLGISVGEAAKAVYEVGAARMTDALRLLVARRGVDPRGLTLVAAGGAFPLFAAHVAAELGIARVVVPAAASTWCAWGLAGMGRGVEVVMPCRVASSAWDQAAVDEALVTARSRALAALGSTDDGEGLVGSPSLEVRYADQHHAVDVDAEPCDRDGLGARFHRRHQELFGYAEPTRPWVIDGLRYALREPQRAIPSGAPAVLAGSIDGPAVIPLAHTSVVLPRGWVASSDDDGALILTAASTVEPDRAPAADPAADDAILRAVLAGRFDAIAGEMGSVLERSARSPIFAEACDFSCGVCDAAGESVSQLSGIPILAAAGSASVQAVIGRYGDDIADGDAFIVNDPYHGGNHLPDIGIVTPVFVEGELMFFCVSRAHHGDIGGSAAGSYNARATEIFQEGLRIPPTRVARRGRMLDDVMDLIALNTRNPTMLRGDLLAQMGANEVGRRRVLHLVETYGAGPLRSAVADLLDHAEALARERVGALPDGTYTGREDVDDDGFDAGPIRIEVAVTVRGSSVVVDLTGTDPQVQGFVNSSWVTTRTAAAIAVLWGLGPDVPRNGGAFRVVEVVAPLGCLVNPRPPAPVTLCTLTPAGEIIAAVFKALQVITPERLPAGFGRFCGPSFYGVDPRDDAFYVGFAFCGLGSGGAVHGRDGLPYMSPLSNHGGVRTPNIEANELQYPHLTLCHELEPDTGGPGRWRGGPGLRYEIQPYDPEPSIVMFGDGMKVPPYGWGGGHAGSLNRAWLRRRHGGTVALRSKEAPRRLHPGDSLVLLSSGGGGWGDPYLRDPDAVEADVRDGLVSVAAARDAYGVVVTDGRVDPAATAELRQTGRAVVSVL